MDWFLSISTLLVNAGLGWYGRKWWMWIIHSINASLWIYYSISIHQYGLIALSLVTVLVDLGSSWKMYKNGKQTGNLGTNKEVL